MRPKDRSVFTCTQCGTQFRRAPDKIRGRPFCSMACYRIAGPLRESTVDRLWSHVCKTACCWIWYAGRTPDGYGKLMVSRRYRLAHQVSYELAYGSIPADKIVLHQCDVPCCVRPDHLTLGTKSQNTLEWHQRRNQTKCCETRVIWV